MSRKKTVKLIAGMILLVLLGIWFRGCFPPSQRSLVRNFQRHRDSFEKVRVMLDEDRAILWEVTFDGCTAPDELIRRRPEDVGLPAQRHSEYRKLLKRVGAIMVSRQPDETRFLVAGSGFGSHGWRVAIAHRTTEPNDVISSLKEFRPDGSSSTWSTGYCPIVDGWYISITW